ncbi:MAG: hypothetical protein P8170_19270 [Gemmatimonadota bacterium]
MTENTPTGKARATLSPTLGAFLIELSIGVHRYGMYPKGHPALESVARNIALRLEELLKTRASLSIGVADRRLVVEGTVTDQGHPVLADLARRLHDHQLGAVSFQQGVTEEEIARLVETLAVEVDRGGQAIGLRPPDEIPRSAHTAVHPLGYGQLSLRADEEGDFRGADRASVLWLGLAQAAMASEEVLAEAPDTATIARSIQARRGESGYDEVIVGYLLQLSDELKGRGGGDVGNQVAELVKSLDGETLARLLHLGGSAQQRRRFLLSANEGLDVVTVVRLLEAAATSGRQTISTSMTRMLNKLATHASRRGGGSRASADVALREHVEALIDDWGLEDPNPVAYTGTLDAMARAASVFKLHEGELEDISGSARIVEMALELDAYGPIVSRAATDLVNRGEADLLVGRLNEADAESVTARRIREEVTHEDGIELMLSRGRLGRPMLRVLTGLMGDEAAERLLDVLEQSEIRSVRRLVFEMLAELGPSVAEEAVARLDDPRWFVQRNMLALLKRLDAMPSGFEPRRYLEHEDGRVRLEAVSLALTRKEGRERTLVAALSDPDEQVARIALLTLQRDVPDSVLPTLVRRVVANDERSDEIRALGATIASRIRSPLALNALLELATAGRTFFGKPKVAPASPMVLAALRGLARTWPGEGSAVKLLGQAARSKDPRVRAAGEGEGLADPMTGEGSS